MIADHEASSVKAELSLVEPRWENVMVVLLLALTLPHRRQSRRPSVVCLAVLRDRLIRLVEGAGHVVVAVVAPQVLVEHLAVGLF